MDRRGHWFRLLAALALAGTAVLGACTSGDDDDASDDTAEDGGGGGGGGGDLLASVQDEGTVSCGTRDDLPGFATLDAAGEHVGFDADFCRVIAAAVLGDAEAVEFVDLATEARFTALQSGEVDVLVRNTTATATRDGSEGATFLQPTFYDGQGMMVTAASGVQSIEELGGQTICVAGGTTSEGNVATEFARLGIAAPEVLTFEDVVQLQQAFEAGRCDGWSSDRSQLTGLRSSYPAGADSLVILEGAFSKEPLAPAVADGDAEWASAVDWAVMATIQAEEFGITSENVDQIRETTTNPAIQSFLGVAVDGTTLDPGLGLPTDFAYQVIKQVGSYAEIYDRHITPLGLDRGPNALWTDGGLQYALPYR